MREDTSVNGRRQLFADEGKWLTNGRRYTKSVTLRDESSRDNWEEVPESEVPADQRRAANRQSGNNEGEVNPQVGGQDQGDTPDPDQDQSDDIEVGQ